MQLPVNRDLPRIECLSRVSRVAVHSRGAIVERTLELPRELPDGEVEIAVREIPISALPGSLRLRIENGERQVVAIRAERHQPAELAPRGQTEQRLTELQADLARVRDELDQFQAQKRRLLELQVAPRGRREWAEYGAVARIADALAIEASLDQRLFDIDEKILDRENAQRELEREIEAAQWANEQASSQERRAESDPTLDAIVQLKGQNTPSAIFLAYAVPYARWWPIYTLQLREGGQRAELIIEGLIAQDTGEDWSQVELSLSTANIAHDARLPSLKSLRISRTQAVERSGWRPPPEGLERLFGPYDALMERALAKSAAIQPRGDYAATGAPPPPNLVQTYEVSGMAAPAGRAPAPSGLLASQPKRKAYAEEEAPSDIAFAAGVATATPGDQGAHRDKKVALDDDDAIAYGIPTMPLRAESRGSAVFGGIGGLFESGASTPTPRAQSSRARVRNAPAESSEAVLAVDVLDHIEDEWLNFDMLELHGASSIHRGHLRPASVAKATHSTQGLSAAIERAESMRACDPMDKDGHFDHCYTAAGRIDVPADALTHRVEIRRAERRGKLGWRTVPREEPKVFRMVKLTNPHDEALLAGPMDIFVEGSYLTTTHIRRVGRGGELTVGLGEDPRIHVARNVQVSDQQAGFLNNKTSIRHDIHIELQSSLGFPAQVEVLDRQPVTDNDEIEIERLDSSPQVDSYDQVKDGRPVRGGLRWMIEVPAGAKTTLSLSYQIVINAKYELWGGNRRE